MPASITIKESIGLDKQRPSSGVLEDLPLYSLKASTFGARSNPASNDLLELALSIKEKGLLQPLLVRPQEDFFEIIGGNRRFAACKILGWRKIMCHIYELEDREAFEISLIENLQRKSLDPVEEALAYRKYVDECGWGSVNDLGQRLGKSHSYISKRLSLLNLPRDVIELVRHKDIAVSTAEELFRLSDSQDQSRLAKIIAERRPSVMKIRRLLNDDSFETRSSGDLINDILPSKYSDNKDYDKSFDKVIINLKIALRKIGPIIEDAEDDWVVHEILMHHKNILHQEIDSLLKAKKKCRL
jgi:ParB family chromosome partitioning protein